jgi:hypothetical protein
MVRQEVSIVSGGEGLRAPDVVPLVLEACPSFRPVWQEHRANWGAQDAGGYNDTADVARHIVDLARAEYLECFPPLFALIEHLILTGDEEVQGLATVGILESIQNVAANTGVTQELFLPWLGPHSRQAWDELKDTLPLVTTSHFLGL